MQIHWLEPGEYFESKQDREVRKLLFESLYSSKIFTTQFLDEERYHVSYRWEEGVEWAMLFNSIGQKVDEIRKSGSETEPEISHYDVMRYFETMVLLKSY